MIKNLFKLDFILIILSLTFIHLSCNNDNSEDENENIDQNKKEETMNLSEKENKALLGGIVNYGGSYYGKMYPNAFMSISFEKENKLKTNIFHYKEDDDKSPILYQSEYEYQILDILPLKDPRYHRIKAELIFLKTTLLDDEFVTLANTEGFSKHKDWQKGIPKDLTPEIIDISTILSIFVLLVSEDKNSITSIEEDFQTIVLTYQQ